MRINTNVLSLSTQRNLAVTTRALSRAMQRLASGSRINSAGDDAAGLAIGNGLESQRRGTVQAIRNMNDARGFLDTAEGSMATQTQIVQRMRELAMQASNGTLSDSSRNYLDKEAQQLLEEFNRVTSQTEFNGVRLLDGTFATKSLQVGVKKGQTIDFNLANMLSSQVFTTSVTSSGSSVAVGDGTFQARTTMSSGAGTDMVTADLNGDGNLDLVVASFTGISAQVFLGNGNGTFKAPTSLTPDSAPVNTVVADLDKDGNLDLIMGCSNGAGNINIFLGNGNGTFQARRTISGGTNPWQVAVGDINGDGNLDIVNGSNQISVSSVVSISLGNGNGTFQARTTLLQDSVPFYVTLKDFNGDSKLDLVSFGAEGSNLYLNIALGNGNGTFATRKTYLSSGSVNTITSADVNGDGKLDVLTADYGDETASIFLGNGNGTFAARTTVDIGAIDQDGSCPTQVLAVDINGDGKLDLVSADYNSSNPTLSTLLGNGDGTFQARKTLATGAYPQAVVAADFNGNGTIDLVGTDSGDSTISIFLGNSTSVNGGETSASGAATISLTSQTNASNALAVLDSALTYINSARSSIGALQSRLDFAQSVGETVIENISQARSQIMDADYSIETANLTRLQIFQQAGIAVLGQTNISSRLALKLLENIG